MKQQAQIGCGSPEHTLSRRTFLGTLAATGSLAMPGLTGPLSAKELGEKRKQVLVVYLQGGVSQLETWDPKPGTSTGGPFQKIATSVPGIHISELLPETAKIMHRLAIVRGVNTRENNHSKGSYFMHTGRKQERNMDYPHLGSVVSKLTNAAEETGLPGYIHITPRGGSGFNSKDAAFLGPRYASVTLANGAPPPNLKRPTDLTLDADKQRNLLREKLNKRFGKRRPNADTEAYTGSYDQAAQLMARKELFDLSKEPTRNIDKYGKHDFGRNCLMARRLLEAGTTFVKVSHRNYDTHYENFDFHIEQLGEFDNTFATLINDLHERSLLQNTLVVVMSEFGRTPRINRNLGRDHWGTAWSVALGGHGINAGSVVGKTNKEGTKVVEREVHGGHLFHTCLQALGFDSTRNHYIDQRPIPMADPKAEPIKEILA